MKKKIGLIALAIFFLALLVGGAYFIMRGKPIQEKAVTVVKNQQRLESSYMGRPYHPYEFGELTPICLSDGTLIGYSIEHKFFNSDDKTFRNLCHARYFLDDKLHIVHSGSMLRDPEQLDSVGRKKLEERWAMQ
jgi:hypothetical protein